MIVPFFVISWQTFEKSVFVKYVGAFLWQQTFVSTGKNTLYSKAFEANNGMLIWFKYLTEFQ